MLNAVAGSIRLLKHELRLEDGLCLQESDWAAGGTPWNPPTSHMLEPMSNHTFGFCLFTAPSICARDAGLAEAGKAAAQGVPGALLRLSYHHAVYGPTCGHSAQIYHPRSTLCMGLCIKFCRVCVHGREVIKRLVLESA